MVGIATLLLFLMAGATDAAQLDIGASLKLAVAAKDSKAIDAATRALIVRDTAEAMDVIVEIGLLSDEPVAEEAIAKLLEYVQRGPALERLASTATSTRNPWFALNSWQAWRAGESVKRTSRCSGGSTTRWTT